MTCTLIRTHLTTVSRVARLGARMVRVTCTGGDLLDYEPLGPDQFVYVLAPPPGRRTLTIGRGFAWADVARLPVGERPVGAYYTVRHWRPDAAELDLLVLLHDGPGDGSAWARRVAAGDPVALWGPRRTYDPPTDTDRHVLVGDETGLPAIAAILEKLPQGAPVDVIVEAGGGDARLLASVVDLADPTTVRWLHRDGTSEAGSVVTLADAVAELDLSAGTVYAWGGGESRAMAAVRRHLRDVVGLGPERVAMTAYWRRAATSADPVEG